MTINRRIDPRQEEEEAKKAISAMAEEAKKNAENTKINQNIKSVRELQYKDN